MTSVFSGVDLRRRAFSLKLMARPSWSSPLTAFRLRRISSGSLAGLVHELRRRSLLYVAGGSSVSERNHI